MTTVTFDRVMGNINHCATWPKAATNRLEFGKDFPHGQMGRLFFGFWWQRFSSLALKHLLLEDMVPWHFKLAWDRAATGSHLQPYLLFYAGTSWEQTENEGVSSMGTLWRVTGDWKRQPPRSRGCPRYPFWEVCEHLPNLQQILNTSQFSIQLLLCP